MNELDILKQTFSDNLKYYLNLRGYLQSDLTAYMDVSGSTASDWCNAKKMPRMDKIQKICDWLSITRDDLLDDKSNVSNRDSLTANEIQLIKLFNSLNFDGQSKLLSYADDLFSMPKYHANDL